MRDKIKGARGQAEPFVALGMFDGYWKAEVWPMVYEVGAIAVFVEESSQFIQIGPGWGGENFPSYKRTYT